MHWDATVNDRVRRWLGTVPRPEVCRGELANGEERRVKMPRRGKLLDVCAALDGCVRIEALNAEDEVLRVFDLEDVATVQQPDPEMNRGELATIARIISDAHDRGAKVANEANKAGNETMAKLMIMMTDRVSALELHWQRQLASLQKESERRVSELDQREQELATRAEDDADEKGLDGAAKQLVEAVAPGIGAAIASKLFGGTDAKPPAPNGSAS